MAEVTKVEGATEDCYQLVPEVAVEMMVGPWSLVVDLEPMVVAVGALADHPLEV